MSSLHHGASDPVNRTKRFLIAFYVPLGLLFLSLPTVSFGDEPLESEERFSMKYSSTLLLSVQAFDEEFTCIVDTGAGVTAFDASLRPRLGRVVEKITLVSIAGKREIDLFEAPDVRYGHGWKMPLGKTVGAFDLSSLTRILMTENVGVCGPDFLESRILLINFDENYFQFPLESKLQRTLTERFSIREGTLRVLIRLPDIGFRSFVLDTGSSGASVGLDSNDFNELVRRHKIALSVNRTSSDGTAAIRTARSGFLETFDLGDHRFHDVSVVETPQPKLGMNFFRRFNIEFDFPRRVVRFQPGKTIDRKDRKVRFGIGQNPEYRDKFIAGSVDEAGPMANAGLQAGDELLSINGIGALRFFGDLSLNGGNLDQEDNQVPVRFKRDGVERDVIVTFEVLTNAFPTKPAHEIVKPDDDF